jgi:hypothetical protein
VLPPVAVSSKVKLALPHKGALEEMVCEIVV